MLLVLIIVGLFALSIGLLIAFALALGKMSELADDS